MQFSKKDFDCIEVLTEFKTVNFLHIYCTNTAPSITSPLLCIQ